MNKNEIYTTETDAGREVIRFKRTNDRNVLKAQLEVADAFVKKGTPICISDLMCNAGM